MTQYGELQGRTVWIPVAPSKHGRQTTYHLREGCSSAETRKIGLDQLAGTFKLCQYCKAASDEYDFERDQGGACDGLECPKCEETVQNPPIHIRNCDGGDDS